MKYLLIDGNNLACRSAFANADLKNSDGILTGVHFGTIRSLLKFKKDFSDYIFLVAWDGKSKRRHYESQKGVEQEIISSLYKSNRDQTKPEIVNLHEQKEFLMKGIDTMGIAQIHYSDYEADDVIFSYAKKLRDEHEVIVITSDNDYYQLLHDNVRIYDDMKKVFITKDSFMKETGLTPEQHVHVGALMGDAGDNIFGVPGWGVKTGIKEVISHKDYLGVLNYYNEKYSNLRDDYPDLEDLNELMSIKLKNDSIKYKEVTVSCPYTGVALAKEQNKIKIPQSAIWLLLFQKRVHLAYSLKKMDNIPDLPEIPDKLSKRDDLFEEYLQYYEMNSLSKNYSEFEIG